MKFNIIKNGQDCGFVIGDRFNLIKSNGMIDILDENKKTITFFKNTRLTKVENKDDEYNLYLEQGE